MTKLDLVKLDEPPLHGKRVASYTSGVETAEQLARRMAEEHGYLSGARLGWFVRFERSPRPYAESIEFVDLYLLERAFKIKEPK